MKRTKILPIVLLTTVIISSCKQGHLWKARDLTPEHVFTSGIEGPASIKNGSLYVVNYQKEGTIGIVDSLGRSSLFCTLPQGSIGNGIRFDKGWNMYIADYRGHNILLMHSGEKNITVYAHDSTMSGPNDIAITSNGILFASAPDWDKSTGSIYRIASEGNMIKVDSALGTTNGIEVSPEDKFLYVNESVQKKIWRYQIDTAGNISGKTLFFSFPDFGLDGMRCDITGNLYVCRYDKGTVAIISPEGKLIREVELKGKKVSNITFGGYDGKTCYVTLQDRGCIEVFKTDTPGREWTFFQ